jgi:hypothetical protein
MYLPEQLIELAAASNDVRYYLQGVYYDAPEKRWIATNGHMLVCLPAECGEGETFPSCSGIVPIEAFTLARKVGKSRLGKNLRIPCELVEIEGAHARPIDAIAAAPLAELAIQTQGRTPRRQSQH